MYSATAPMRVPGWNTSCTPRSFRYKMSCSGMTPPPMTSTSPQPRSRSAWTVRGKRVRWAPERQERPTTSTSSCRAASAMSSGDWRMPVKMTSKPASRRPRATTLAPRSWPSRPGLAISTRMVVSSLIVGTSVDSLLRPQVCQALLAVFQRAGQDLFRMLTEKRRRGVALLEVGRGGGQMHGVRDQPHFPAQHVGHGHDRARGLHLRVLDGFGQVAHQLAGDIGLVQELEPFLRRAPAERLLQLAVERLAVPGELPLAGEALVLEQVHAVYGAAERLKLERRGDGDMAVSCLIDAVREREDVAGADVLEDGAGHSVEGDLVRELVDHRLQKGSLDLLAPAGALPLVEGGDGAGDSREGGALVRHGHAVAHRALLRVAGDGDRAAHGLDAEIVGGAVTVGPQGAEAGDGGADNARIDGAERLIVQPQPLGYARAEVVDYDIRGADKVVQHLAPFGLGDVQRQALLAAVYAEEVEVHPLVSEGT